jgi:hypothetical protein
MASSPAEWDIPFSSTDWDHGKVIRSARFCDDGGLTQGNGFLTSGAEFSHAFKQRSPS